MTKYEDISNRKKELEKLCSSNVSQARKMRIKGLISKFTSILSENLKGDRHDINAHLKGDVTGNDIISNMYTDDQITQMVQDADRELLKLDD